MTDALSAMHPAFGRDVHHYFVRCEPGSTIRVQAVSNDGVMKVELNGSSLDSLSVDANLTVSQDQDIAIELSGGTEIVTYVVHCVPQNYPDITILRKDSIGYGWTSVHHTSVASR